MELPASPYVLSGVLAWLKFGVKDAVGASELADGSWSPVVSDYQLHLTVKSNRRNVFFKAV